MSRRQVPNTQTVQKSSQVLTEFKLVSAKEAKEIIQFERVDLEHVEEWTKVPFPAEIDENLAKRDAAFKKQAARETANAGHV